jgi:hypothetical protein
MGSVWYLGEEATNSECADHGMLLDTDFEGAWESGEDIADSRAVAGNLFKASAVDGDTYQREHYAGEAEDMAQMVATNVTVTLADESKFTN